MNRVPVAIFLCILLFTSLQTSAQHFTEFDLISNGSSWPRDFNIVGNKLVFAALDTPGLTAQEGLWVSDGSPAGTHFLKRINANTLNPQMPAVPNSFIKHYGKLYFFANNALNGNELWVTDGTTLGTAMVKDVNPGYNGCLGRDPVNYAGKLFFYALSDPSGWEPWVTDGSNSGTQLFKDINAGGFSFGFLPGFSVRNSRLYFAADDGPHSFEPWVTDGSANGTQMLKDINPVASSTPRDFYEFNNKTFFIAIDGTNGDEIWVTNGTTAGTQMLKDINQGAQGSSCKWIGACNNKLFFYADDDNSMYGHELWQTDGTTLGTALVANLCPGTGNAINKDSSDFIISGNKIYFTADNCVDGAELWVTDGTATGTYMVKDISAGAGESNPYRYFEYDGRVYFNANDGVHGNELWVTDGTSIGTQLVKDIAPGSASGNPRNIFAYHNKLYFAADIAASDAQMFQSDGTETGTVLLTPPGSTHTNPLAKGIFKGFTEFNNKLFFAAEFFLYDAELWSFQDTTIVDTTLSVRKNNTQFQTLIYPNPVGADEVVSIEYNVAEAGNVTVKLTDLMGRVVAIINGGNETAGKHTIRLSASDYHLSAGMYSLQLTTIEGTAVRKINIR